MNTKYKQYLFISITSIILGIVCFYVYLCFQGVLTAWLIDIGYYRILSKLIAAMFDSGSSRSFSFLLLNFFKDIFVQLILFTLFLYWFSMRFHKRLILSVVFLLIGALLYDAYFYLRYSNDFFSSVLSYTIFFDGIIVNYLFNLSLWGFVFTLSIILGSFIRENQLKKKTTI